jgi:hypothetical protein
MSTSDMIEHNDSLCCICMATEGSPSNFSYWECNQHAENICTSCRDQILSQGRNSANCPICRSVPIWNNICRKNSQCYIDLAVNRGYVISSNLEIIIINYINTHTDE